MQSTVCDAANLSQGRFNSAIRGDLPRGAQAHPHGCWLDRRRIPQQHPLLQTQASGVDGQGQEVLHSPRAKHVRAAEIRRLARVEVSASCGSRL